MAQHRKSRRSTRRTAAGNANEVALLKQEIIRLRESIRALNMIQEQYSRHQERMMMMNHVTQSLNRVDIAEIGNIAVRKIPELVQARFASVFVADYGTDQLILLAHNHPTEMPGRLVVQAAPDTIMGQAVRRKEILVIPDIEEYQKQYQIRLQRTFAEKYATKSCVCAPLKVQDYLVGVLNLADKRDGTEFHAIEDVPVIEQMAQVLAMALRNARLFEEIREQARTDGLTSLLNYREFYTRLEQEVHRAERYGRPLALAMLDLDNFKAINDRWGHPVGDRVLAELARAVRSRIRQEDIVARYGGDELALLLPETPLEGARAAAERVVTAVRALRIEGHPDIRLTMSVGIAAFERRMTLTEFVDAADRALYRAKHSGKDRIELAPPKGEPPEPPVSAP
jgi:diguanylate cyclase (GGDEF)-like protein